MPFLSMYFTLNDSRVNLHKTVQNRMYLQISSYFLMHKIVNPVRTKMATISSYIGIFNLSTSNIYYIQFLNRSTQLRSTYKSSNKEKNREPCRKKSPELCLPPLLFYEILNFLSAILNKKKYFAEKYQSSNKILLLVSAAVIFCFNIEYIIEKSIPVIFAHSTRQLHLSKQESILNKKNKPVALTKLNKTFFDELYVFILLELENEYLHTFCFILPVLMHKHGQPYPNHQTLPLHIIYSIRRGKIMSHITVCLSLSVYMETGLCLPSTTFRDLHKPGLFLHHPWLVNIHKKAFLKQQAATLANIKGFSQS